MTSNSTKSKKGKPASGTRHNLSIFSGSMGVTLLAAVIVLLFLAPLLYMVLTSLKTQKQLADPHSQFLPKSPLNYTYQGEDYPLYNVPTDAGMQELALVKPGREASEFIDPANPEAGLVPWTGRWRTLEPVYEIDATLDNFPKAWWQVRLDLLFRNTIIIAVLGTIGTLISSTLVAYGFSRFRIPGIDILFLVLIATIILPRQVTLIPTYIFFPAIGWGGTWWPLIIPHFFSNAYNVFLLRR
ncbi:MAG: carbohydrate ABC transporter permease, partial [Anaerolineae bacterium]|nr:carbohydrate ABC transporter permease [Anaerolineae bacterium]